MAVTRSRARGHKPRAILAGGLLALAALMQMPARAAEQPNLVSASYDTGWSDGKVLVARFDRSIKCVANASANTAGAECEAALSQITVKDAAGATVPGKTYLAYAQDFLTTDTLVWKYTIPANERTMAAGDYSVIIHAVPMVGDFKDFGPTSFKVDAAIPFTPVIGSPENNATLTSGDIDIEGAASDRAPVAYKSGITRVEVRFYNALDPSSYRPGAIQQGAGEIVKLRRNAALSACASSNVFCTDASGNVVQDKAWKTTAKLSSGLWSIQVIAYDLAGNGSIIARRSFIVI